MLRDDFFNIMWSDGTHLLLLVFYFLRFHAKFSCKVRYGTTEGLLCWCCHLVLLQYHPDVCGDLQAAEVFKSINSAYEVLIPAIAFFILVYEYHNCLFLIYLLLKWFIIMILIFSTKCKEL